MKLEEVKIQKGDVVMIPLKGIGECTAAVQEVTDWSIWLESRLPAEFTEYICNRTGDSLKELLFQALPIHIMNRVNRIKVWYKGVEGKFTIRIKFQLLL